jgi:hypothetical protein
LGAIILVVVYVSVSQAQGVAASLRSAEFFETLNITGFIQNTSGTFLDTEAIEYNSSKNSLASERNMIQVDVNDDLSERDSIFLRVSGVYEPSFLLRGALRFSTFDFSANAIMKSSEIPADISYSPMFVTYRQKPLAPAHVFFSAR